MQSPKPDKVCLVTGANRGIGFALAEGMAREGFHVVMLCRSEASATQAREAILANQPDASVAVMLCDLSSQAAIRDFVSDFSDTYKRLDVLFNNAAILPFRREETEDGLELVFAVNYLAAFQLSTMLLPVLRKAAPARVINVLGRLHHRGKIHLDDLQFTQGYNTLKAGTQAVLAKTILTHEFDRRFASEGVRSMGFHPGTVDTDMTRHAPGLLRWLAALLKPFKVSATEGAAPGIMLATSPALADKGGLYYDRMKPSRSSELSRDPMLGKRLWEASEALLQGPTSE